MAGPLGGRSEADDIQNQMRELRAELRDDVQEVVTSAHRMADIGNYVRAYPWLCAGAAFALGYVIVPTRATVIRPDAEALIELAKKHKLVVKTDESSPKKKRVGLLGQLLSLAAATLVQGGLKIATQQLSEAFAHNAHAHSNGHSPGVAP